MVVMPLMIGFSKQHWVMVYIVPSIKQTYRYPSSWKWVLDEKWWPKFWKQHLHARWALMRVINEVINMNNNRSPCSWIKSRCYWERPEERIGRGGDPLKT